MYPGPRERWKSATVRGTTGATPAVRRSIEYLKQRMRFSAFKLALITSSSSADEHTRTVHVCEDDLVEAHEEDDERHDTSSPLCSNKAFAPLGHDLAVHYSSINHGSPSYN